ncbi:cytochrome c-type biogenesis CcmF C-terminal domain-containing protein [Methanohalobium sp.]|uniref:cytochrome c-type biogenesis CcmF C-terminal domain-containing protein n=1 Tax=Methanohalobium sp. TaxID=2837493 RepID=UPI0025F58200|nr:cytochrome c-type biogenesis CcmF C-terminal domain-containing protein [Methanohalobium sp.]
MTEIKQILTKSNVMLVALLVFVLLAALITVGMLTPLLVDFLTGNSMNLDAYYFNIRAALPTGVLIILLSIYLLLGKLSEKKLFVTVSGVVVLSAVFAFMSPFNSLPVDFIIPVSVLAIIAIFYNILYSVTGWKYNPYKNTRSISAHIIHLGLVLIMLGVVLSTGLTAEDSTVVSTESRGFFEGQDYSVSVTKISTQFEGEPFKSHPGSAYVTDISFDVYKNGDYFDSGNVKSIRDLKWDQSYTTTYIHRNLLEEYFIAPKGVDMETGKVNLYSRTVPFITFVWGGLCLMAFGILSLLVIGHLKNKEKINKSE